MQRRSFDPKLAGLFILALATACAGPPRASSTTPASLRRDPRADGRPKAAGASRIRPDDAERELAVEARLETIRALALAANPELAEARERLRAARERAPALGRLPDPELEYQLWGQPAAHPLSFGEAQMHMIGVRQALPAPGSLGARSDAAEEQANVLSASRRAREQELTARVRRAFAEYYRADREYLIRTEHVALAEQILDLARAAYQGGRGTQQDVLRALVELSRLHNDLANVDAERRSARGLLNMLMARPVQAPLGPPAAIEPSDVVLRIDRLERLAMAQRPEVTAAEAAIRAKQGELEAARAAARWPSFMVGVQYMYMPPEVDPHNYGVTLSMSLPWLNPRSREEVRAAEASLAAEQSALSSVRNAARFELYDAAQHLRSARESFAIIERDLLPRARQSFDSARALYRGGQTDSLAVFDALRALLDVRIERERALARLESASAGVERAVGLRDPKSESPAGAGK